MAEDQTTVLYRPVGETELRAIESSGWRAFPPRESPPQMFCPLESEQDAVRIARDWNTRDARSGFAGYVVRFRVRSVALKRFEVRAIGDAREHWIPAGDLAEFNRSIVGKIERVHEFHWDGRKQG
jgi:hypothetical protein